MRGSSDDEPAALSDEELVAEVVAEWVDAANGRDLLHLRSLCSEEVQEQVSIAMVFRALSRINQIALSDEGNVVDATNAMILVTGDTATAGPITILDGMAVIDLLLAKESEGIWKVNSARPHEQ
jgi:ketosteroid isomerase-like protein